MERLAAHFAVASRIPCVLLVLAALVVLSGCASGRTGSITAPEAAASCTLTPRAETGPEESGTRASGLGAEASRAPVAVGLTDSVTPGHAPVPTNPGEAFLFATLYEPLIRMDCTGRLYPGLASTWRSEDSGRRWSFTLRDGARFWNGDPVTARDVAESWWAAEAAGRAPWGSYRPVSVEVLDARRLRLVFGDPWTDPPSVLTAPELAVVRRGEPGPWPVSGTGSYRVTRTTGSPVRQIYLESVAGSSAAASSAGRAGAAPPLEIHVDPDSDPRDLLDRGADLLFTGDPETLAYVRLRPELSSRPLPWSRTYVLVRQPAGAAGGPVNAPEPVGAPDPATPPDRAAAPDLIGAPGAAPASDRVSAPDSTGASGAVPLGFLRGLARDVVREEARPAGQGECPIPYGGSLPVDRLLPDRAGGDPPAGSSIVFDDGDATGRALAERLVALATSPPGASTPETATALRALGLSDPPPGLVARPAGAVELPRGPRIFAQVVGLAHAPGTACPPEDFTETRPPNVRAVPLVETRRNLITRAPALPVVVDGSGTPFIPGPGTAAGRSGDP